MKNKGLTQISQIHPERRMRHFMPIQPIVIETFHSKTRILTSAAQELNFQRITTAFPIELLGTVNVCKPNSIHPVVVKILHLNPKKENFSLLWVPDRIIKASWIHPLVTMVVCTKCHGRPSHIRRSNDPGHCCHTSQQSSPEMASRFRRHDFRQQQAGSLSKPPPTCHLRSTPAPLLFYLLPNLSLYDSPKAPSSSSKLRVKHKHTLFMPNNFHTWL